MNLNRIFGAIWTIAAVAIVAGCGGGGGGSSTPPVVVKASPTISVDWPVRSRNLAGPSSALSVAFTLHAVLTTTPDVTLKGDRSSNLTAHTDAYTTATTTPVGEYLLTATFYAGAGETGATVGTASVDVDLTSTGSLTSITGTPLGSISFQGTVVKAVVAAGQTVTHAGTTTLTATAYDASNNVVVVSPGSFTFSLASGSSNLTLAANGDATGLTEGTATVTASIDGVTSQAASVSVVPSQVSVAQTAYGFTYDSTRKLVYATIYPWINNSQSAVVALDPTTGNITQTLVFAHTATLLTESGNGSHLYVLTSDQVISQIDLSTFSVVQTLALPSNTYGTQLLSVPGATDSWVLATEDITTSPLPTQVYDGMVVRANAATLGTQIAVNDSGTQIYGYTDYASSNAYSYATLSASGITGVVSVPTSINSTINAIHYIDGYVVSDDGKVINPTTGALVRTLAIPTENSSVAVVPGTTRVYVAGYSPFEVLCYDVSNGSLLYTYSLTGGLTGNLSSVTSLGQGGLVMSNNSSGAATIQLVGGLP